MFGLSLLVNRSTLLLLYWFGFWQLGGNGYKYQIVLNYFLRVFVLSVLLLFVYLYFQSVLFVLLITLVLIRPFLIVQPVIVSLKNEYVLHFSRWIQYFSDIAFLLFLAVAFAVLSFVLSFALYIVNKVGNLLLIDRKSVV